jgi:hypothetical protein
MAADAPVVEAELDLGKMVGEEEGGEQPQDQERQRGQRDGPQ